MDKKVPISYDKGIKDSRVDVSFLGSVEFENMIKRRFHYIDNMFFMAENNDSRLIKAIDRIIELSAPINE